MWTRTRTQCGKTYACHEEFAKSAGKNRRFSEFLKFFFFLTLNVARAVRALRKQVGLAMKNM